MKKVVIIACGTASYAGMAGQYAIEQLCGVPVVVDVASELQNRECMFDKDTLGIAISQSGETADTLQAIRMARRRGAKVLAVTNVIGSSVARESDGVALHPGRSRRSASPPPRPTPARSWRCCSSPCSSPSSSARPSSRRRPAALLRAIKELPDQAAEFLKTEADHVKALAEKYCGCKRYLYLGRGSNYSTAMEGALKLKEIAYIDAEGYAAGEMKHGPLALVTSECAVMSTVVHGTHYEKSLEQSPGDPRPQRQGDRHRQ